jgi:hypothetical protein
MFLFWLLEKYNLIFLKRATKTTTVIILPGFASDQGFG